ncbi:MAG: hypothetical protein R3232_06500 [Clostridia bacterium]|nr:hypothetical protein [Clostridia bacterium]
MLRNKEGKALVIVIILLALLAILAPAIVISSNTEVNHTTIYRNRMQAYLYARSGIDSALDWLIVNDKVNDRFVDSADLDGLAFMSGSLGSMSLFATDPNDDEDISVMLEDVGAGVKLTSVGVFKGAQKTIELTVYLTAIGGEEITMPPIDKALFLMSDGDGPSLVMDFDSNSAILGNFGANTTGEETLNLAQKEMIDGDVYLHASVDDNVFDVKNGDPQTGDIYYDQPKVIYPAPLFPDEYTVTNNMGDIIFDHGTHTYNLTSTDEEHSDGFGDIILDGNCIVNFDLDGQDRFIICDTLQLDSNSTINLLRRGEKGLSIYVRETFTLNSNSTINTGDEGGDYHNLTIFYAGTEPLVFDSNGEIAGSIVTKTADFSCNSNTIIRGHLVIGGDNMIIDSNVYDESRVIYAPNAHLILNSNSTIFGAVIANTAEIDSNATIIYDPSDITGLPGGVIPGAGTVIPIVGGESEFVVSSYYWQ